MLVSPGTGFTLTCTLTFSPNGKSGKSENVTILVSPGSITSIVPFFTIGVGCAGMVSVTFTPTSWFSPEFCTPTSNERSVEMSIFVSEVVESWMFAGCTFVYASALPCEPDEVPPVEAPCTRCQIELIDRGVYRSAFWTNTDAGAFTPSTPSEAIVSAAAPWKRSFHTTSLASRRWPCAASCSPAEVASSPSFVARNVSRSPCSPVTRRSSAWIALAFAGVSGPGASMSCARVTSSCACWISPPRRVSSVACVSPGVVSSVARFAPIFWESVPTGPISPM